MPLFRYFRQLPGALQVSCALTWFCYLLLLTLFAVINTAYDSGSLGLWVLQSLPLLLLSPLLIKHSYRAYSGLALLILVYFVATVPEVMAPTVRWYEHAILGLSLFIFLFAMYSSRWLQRWQKGAQ